MWNGLVFWILSMLVILVNMVVYLVLWIGMIGVVFFYVDGVVFLCDGVCLFGVVCWCCWVFVGYFVLVVWCVLCGWSCGVRVMCVVLLCSVVCRLIGNVCNVWWLVVLVVVCSWLCCCSWCICCNCCYVFVVGCVWLCVVWLVLFWLMYGWCWWIGWYLFCCFCLVLCWLDLYRILMCVGFCLCGFLYVVFVCFCLVVVLVFVVVVGWVIWLFFLFWFCVKKGGVWYCVGVWCVGMICVVVFGWCDWMCKMLDVFDVG